MQRLRQSADNAEWAYVNLRQARETLVSAGNGQPLANVSTLASRPSQSLPHEVAVVLSVSVGVEPLVIINVTHGRPHIPHEQRSAIPRP